MAIYADRWNGGDIDDDPGYFADEARRAARIALSALLPPSEEMVQAMMRELHLDWDASVYHERETEAAFTAAINLILAEGEGNP